MPRRSQNHSRFSGRNPLFYNNGTLSINFIRLRTRPSFFFTTIPLPPRSLLVLGFLFFFTSLIDFGLHISKQIIQWWNVSFHGIFQSCCTILKDMFFRLHQGFPITDFKCCALYKTFHRLWTFATLKGEYMTVSLNTTLFLTNIFYLLEEVSSPPRSSTKSYEYHCDKLFLISSPLYMFLTVVKEHSTSYHKLMVFLLLMYMSFS